MHESCNFSLPFALGNFLPQIGQSNIAAIALN
jgi:hypothetical protein